MPIKQISGKYIQEEDRIILFFNTDLDEEYSFLITRKIASQLIIGLKEKIFTLISREDSRFISNDILKFKDDEIRQNVSFQEIYTGGKTSPLGKKNCLVKNIKFTISNQNKLLTTLHMYLDNNQEIKINLTSRLAIIFKEVLNKLQAKANWGINIDDAPKTPSLDDMNLVAKKGRYIH